MRFFDDDAPGVTRDDLHRHMARFELIEAVGRLHNGRFELADNVPGLVARIVLPVT